MCAKLVSKLLAGQEKDAAQGAGSIGAGMSRALSRALGTLPEQQEHGAHPHHIQLTMNDEVKEQIGAACLSRRVWHFRSMSQACMTSWSRPLRIHSVR